MAEIEKLGASANREEIYATLLALYIMEEVFGDRESEWVMVAKKAKDYLKSVGIAKANRLISSFELDLIN